MCDWKQVSVDADTYSCDPHAPWQRGANEDTNGWLRQYLAKGSDLSAEDLDAGSPRTQRPTRKQLDFGKPIEEIGQLLFR